MKRALILYLITNQIAAAAGLLIIGVLVLAEWIRSRRAAARVAKLPTPTCDYEGCGARRELVAGFWIECTRRKGHDLGDEPLDHNGSITDLEWSS